MRQEKYTAEIEWFNAVEKHAYKEINKLREGGRGHAARQPKTLVEKIVAFFA